MVTAWLLLGMTVTGPWASAQEHKWAGRVLDDFEWAIHGRLEGVQSHDVFDTLSFEVKGKTVVLTGKVLKVETKHNAEAAVARVSGVEKVVNRIEVLPASRRDDLLRKNLYHAIYENPPLDKYAARAVPPIQIIVKNEWVTLEGLVDSYEDRLQANLRAYTVTPHVSDELRVAPVGEPAFAERRGSQ